MEFLDVIAELKAKADDVPEQANPEASDNPLDTKPAGIPMTNRLDRITTEQGAWAIANGTAWIVYLKDKKASGVAVDIVEHEANAVEVSEADTYQAICNTLESVWLVLTDNMKSPYLETEQIPGWVDTLEWAIKSLPEGYEKHRDMIQADLKEHQQRLTKSNNRR